MGKLSIPSYTRIFHHKPYPAIDPTRPELSAKEKVILVTGAGSGIGRAAAIAFAQAGANAVVLTGRTETTLQETKDIIESAGHDCVITVRRLNIADEDNIHAVFNNVINEHGHIDVLVNGAGHLSDAGKLNESSSRNFWDSFDINVKGSFLLQQAFMKQPNNKERDRVLIYLNSMMAYWDAKTVRGTPASYGISKLAQAKLVEYIAAENASDKHFRAYALHPGMVDTDVCEKSLQMGPPGLRDLITYDEPELSGRFFVWLASPKGTCVPSGRYLWANWDVEELEDRANDLAKDPVMLTQTMKGWPFTLPEEER